MAEFHEETFYIIEDHIPKWHYVLYRAFYQMLYLTMNHVACITILSKYQFYSLLN